MGSGFFTVRDPAADSLFATRWGGFQLDAQGYLVTTNGLRVQGFTNAVATQIGDIIIDAAGAPNPSLKMTNYSIGMDGRIFVLLSDGSDFMRGQILPQNYRNLQALKPMGNGLYANVEQAAPIFTNGAAPALVLGQIVPGAVEQPPPPWPTLQLPPASGFRLFVTNLTSGAVESSVDLIHWNTIGQINGSPDLNIGEFFDTPQTPQTSYRVVLPSDWDY
jgi:hypothetical protein